MSSIKVEKIAKSFGNFKAVKNVSFSVAQNRVMGFLGPNGAGKTTTLRMIVGLSKPDAGFIEISGERIVFGRSDANRLLGYLPEQPAFYAWMTGMEYLNFVADLFQIGDRKKTISRLLKRVGLSDAANRRIGGYSNGMKQRLGIAQALVNDPKVLILDEPVSALDPIGRREVLKIIEELKREKSILMSTHILSDVDRICDDIAVINEGRIIKVAPLSELKAHYAKPILEVEFDGDPSKILPKLKAESWVKSAVKNGNLLKIWPKDIKIIETNEALKFLTEQGIGIEKFGLNLPSTEDLFVEILEGE